MATFKVSGSLSQEEIKGGVMSTPAAISGSPQLSCKTDAPIYSVNGKTGDVVLNADDIEPTVSRGWFTTLLANTLSAISQWVSEVGSPHVTSKNNPHETSFLNVKGYPANPEGKVLTDRGTFDYVSAGGATNLPLYASNTDSLASGYKVLKGSPDATEVVKTIIASAATGVVAGEAHLSANPIGVSIIPAGTFEFGYFRSVNSAQGDSFKQVEVFTRSAAGVETSLFTLDSSSIDDTELTERVISRTISQSYAVDPAHFLGVRFKFRTTRATATTLSYIVGGARGWWMRTTLPLKHDDLSDKNGNPDFQHITAAEKTQGALATGNSTLDTVKKIADKVVLDSQVIQEFTTTVATNGFDILTDKFGNALNLPYGTYILNYLAPNGGSGSASGTFVTFNNINTGQNFRQNADGGNKFSGLLVARQDRQYFMFQIIFTFLPNGRIISWYDGMSVINDADTAPSDIRFKAISLISYGASITKISMLALAGLTVNAGVVVQLLKVK